MNRVFLITGTSTGFGNFLVQEVLDRGDIAIATARRPEHLRFNGTTSANFLALKLDVTNPSDIDTAFEAAISKFGRVDVVVNNAGLGVAGAFEELSDAQVKLQMDVNFYGVLAVTKKAMSVMREQKPSGGLIQQVTSIGGQIGLPMVSVYNASKWAVEGFTEAVSQEVKPEWGIRFCCVEPGDFKTEWAASNMTFGAVQNPAYDPRAVRDIMAKYNGSQPGDPVKGAKAMYELAIMENPPLRVVLGTDAYKCIYKKISDYDDNYKKYEKISNSTDFDK